MKEKKGEGQGKYLVPAVDQAARILFCLRKSRNTQMGLIEICEALGIHKSTAYSILQTLQSHGLVRRNGDRQGYSLGPELIALSRKVLDDLDAPRLAQPFLEDLATRIGGTATLGIIARDKVFVVATHEGADIGVSIRVGRRWPVTYGCHGKALAAHLSQEELEEFLAGHQPFFHGTPETFDRSRLEEELEACRRDGFALELGDMKPGLHSLAAAVCGPGGSAIGYIALVGLFSPEKAQEFGPQLVSACRVLSRQLGAPAADND